MANHAQVLDVSEEDLEVLQSRVQARTVLVRDRERARIVLLAALRPGLDCHDVSATGCGGGDSGPVAPLRA